eukprot:403345851
MFGGPEMSQKSLEFNQTIYDEKGNKIYSGSGSSAGVHNQQQQLGKPRQLNKPAEVQLTSDAFRSCLYHAYLTQSEEVAGLLLGYRENCPQDPSRQIVFIHASITQQRKTKEKDRVEIDAMQLYEAYQEAEEMQKQYKGELRTEVVGWYHSHPNITVFPSQVDINTQFGSQLGGNDSFIGLIFSVFVTNNQNNISKSELIAFQSYEDLSEGGVKKACTIPIQQVLLQEQEEDYKQAQKNLDEKNLQKLTNASENILGYCKVLENLSNPTDVALQSYQKNLQKNVDWLRKQNEILKSNVDHLELDIIKRKAHLGLIKSNSTPGNDNDTETPGQEHNLPMTQKFQSHK